MKNLLALLFTLSFATGASAACRNVWVDHDYNASTPAIVQQVCDSTLDVPAINLPGIQPIQKPQVRPIERPTIPPIGTSRCRTQSVSEGGRWVDKQICW